MINRLNFYTVFVFLILFCFCGGKKTEKEETTAGEKQKPAGLKLGDKKANVSEEWVKTVWKEVKTLVNEKRTFPTERITESAAVRGIRPGERKPYPSENDIKKGIEILEKRIQREKDNLDEYKYFLAQFYSKDRQADKAVEMYKDLIKNHKDSKYYKSALQELEKIK